LRQRACAIVAIPATGADVDESRPAALRKVTESLPMRYGSVAFSQRTSPHALRGTEKRKMPR
jgi:hypothetical protein